MQQETKTKNVIWWIKRDLRLKNNPALAQAMAYNGWIVPLFILDPHLLRAVSDRRKAFLFEGLKIMAQDLEKRGNRLVIRHGYPADVLNEMMENTHADVIISHEDFTPYARCRDNKLKKDFPLQLTGGVTILHPLSIHKSDGNSYSVFGPYEKSWRSLSNSMPQENDIISEYIPGISEIRSDPLPELATLSKIPAGEYVAEERLKWFFDHAIDNYKTQREILNSDSTSGLSPYIRFGMLSVKHLYDQAQNCLLDTECYESRVSIDLWIRELIWREFYTSILFNFPHVQNESFKPAMRDIPWRDDPEGLKAWKEGLTGYPVVDAGMRQLSVSGWMHNRARMITASFLVKDLLISWQLGEQWFMDQLIDADPACNNGGWQWSAGTGTDAAPFFRVFNPILQGKKYDPSGNYIRRWVPELSKVPTQWIHEPWRMPPDIQVQTGVKIGKHYPPPIIDHYDARMRAIAVYQSAGKYQM